MAAIETRRARRFLAAALGLGWAISLVLPVADAGKGYESVDGAMVLMIGGLGVFMGQFAWFANPLLFVVLLLCLSSRMYPLLLRWSGGLLVLLTISAAFWSDIPDDAGSNIVERFLPGYWLWMATMGIAGLWAMVRSHLPSRSFRRLPTATRGVK